MLCARALERASAISRPPLVDSRSDARCVLACLPREGHGHFQRDLWNHPHHPVLTPPNPPGCCRMYWDVSAIFVLPSPSDACAPLPAGEDRRRAPTRFVREARGATRVARASAEPACWPSPGPPPGPRGRRFDPPGSKRAVLTPPSGAFVDPTSSRSSDQKYLFTRSLPQVTSGAGIKARV